MIDLSILACPFCTDRPSLEQVGMLLACPVCKREFPLLAGIPCFKPQKDNDRNEVKIKEETE